MSSRSAGVDTVHRAVREGDPRRAARHLARIARRARSHYRRETIGTNVAVFLSLATRAKRPYRTAHECRSRALHERPTTTPDSIHVSICTRGALAFGAVRRVHCLLFPTATRTREVRCVYRSSYGYTGSFTRVPANCGRFWAVVALGKNENSKGSVFLLSSATPDLVLEPALTPDRGPDQQALPPTYCTHHLSRLLLNLGEPR